MELWQCQLKNQGLAPGSCSVRVGDHRVLACQATLKEDQNGLRRSGNFGGSVIDSFKKIK